MKGQEIYDIGKAVQLLKQGCTLKARWGKSLYRLRRDGYVWYRYHKVWEKDCHIEVFLKIRAFAIFVVVDEPKRRKKHEEKPSTVVISNRKCILLDYIRSKWVALFAWRFRKYSS